MAADLEMDADEQDMAEVFDETNITEDGEDIAHPDMERDVFDVTSAEDDADDDEFADEDDEDFDPDQADDAELDSMMEEDDGIDSPRSPWTPSRALDRGSPCGCRHSAPTLASSLTDFPGSTDSHLTSQSQ